MDWENDFFEAVRQDPNNLKECIELAAFAYISVKYNFDVSYIRWKRDAFKGMAFISAKPENDIIQLAGLLAPLLFMNKKIVDAKDLSLLLSTRDFKKLFSVNQQIMLERDPRLTKIEQVINGFRGNISAIPRIAYTLYFETETKKNGWKFLKKNKVLRLIKEESKRNY